VVRGWGDIEKHSLIAGFMQQTSRIELNRRQYRDTDLRYLIQPECDVLDMYVDDIRFAGTRVLEIGPGNGRNTAYLLQAGFSVDAIDNDQSVLEILSKNLEASGIDSSRYYPILQDIANFAFPTNAYALAGARVSRVLVLAHRTCNRAAPSAWFIFGRPQPTTSPISDR
jgi:SAM-dependent methyltransferase